MIKRTAIAALALATILLGCSLAQQAPAPLGVSDQDIRLLRKDLQSTQKQIIAANIPLTDVEAQKFWPLYEQYTAEKVKVNDDKLSIIKDYAANLATLTDNQAQTLVSRWAEADQSAYQLRTKYIPMFQKVLPGKKAALFFQLDRRIGVLLDLQVASQIPLVEP
jgi:Spy/CpxP family protein refolding chaperone